ncbi:hypothetical protein K1514_10650 [Paraclostridium bifermentans]|uniref:hypothetical protein n=1 Tax=Paraclostridium TaxID=1849822 RepID=UPI001CC6538E|nr:MULTISPECIES: hypothetical protein [Paraclostridium]MBZ6006350.1 hypothetical protein [Paraclostridium bifermentans]MDU0298696.1 hypothetical protein [Paraclostridium sp. MRS3W1]
MKTYNSKFFLILSECLIIFMIYGIVTSDRTISNWLITILGISFLFSYSITVLYPKLLIKYGENNYKLILIAQNLFISTILYVLGNTLGYLTNYISFLIQYSLIAIVTYYINKRIYIKEIRYLNNLVKNSKY